MNYVPPIPWACIVCNEKATGFNGNDQPVCTDHADPPTEVEA